MAEQRVRGLSLRRKVTGWLGAILAVTLVSIGMATAVGRWTSTAFDAMLADNSACYTVQDALAAETKAFSRMVREPSQENTEEYQTACEITEASLAELPFDYEKIGEDRYARTWNLLQGYAGYQKYRDAFFADDPGGGYLCGPDVPGDGIAGLPLRVRPPADAGHVGAGERRLQCTGRPAGAAALGVSGGCSLWRWH